jgi:hypothetical protein
MPRVRPGRADDLAEIVAIKEALALDPAAPRQGGFLLGCPPDRYAALLAAGCVLVLETERGVAGFAVTLPDPLLRASELWQRRALIRWRDGESEPPAGEPIAYFDQLAFAPGQLRAYAPALALAAVEQLARDGHVHLFATTLAAPAVNVASLPLLHIMGGRVVGQIEEEYDGVGAVLSDLHHVLIAEGLARVQQSAAGRRAARGLHSPKAERGT